MRTLFTHPKLNKTRTLAWAATFVLVLVLVPACNKDRLEVAPQGVITDDNFFSTPQNALLGVNGVYSVLRQNTFSEGLFPILDIMSDDARKGSNPGDALTSIGVPYDQFQLNPTTTNSQAWYNTLYVGVRRANAVIDRVPTIAMDTNLRARYVAEARFLRALFYLDLARGFGNVPFITSLKLPSLAELRQATAQQIYNEVIVPDLTYAIARLPSTYSGNDLGRATKWAANGLLARAALYFKDYTTAANASNAVITSGLFSLEPDYERAFSVAGQYGPESVFEIGAIGQEDNNRGDQGGNQYANIQGVRTSPNRVWGFNRPSTSLLREFEPGDSRKQKGLIYLGEVIDGVTILGDRGTPDFTLDELPPHDTLEYEIYNQKVWTPGINVPSQWAHHRRMIRYSDILLMAAEAIVKSSGDASTAASFVNLVRARARNGQAGVLPDVLPDGNLLTAIYHERRVELFLESHRFFDLVRTGRTDLMGPLGFIKGKHELQPLPQSEIDIANGKLLQNHGY
jgi:hypothetical protein